MRSSRVFVAMAALALAPVLVALPTQVASAQPPSTQVLVPTTGAAVSGTQTVLDASASSGANEVQFEITGGALTDSTIAIATPTIVGWVALWNTMGVADGSYSLQSVASYSGGVNAVSSPVTINVNNPLTPSGWLIQSTPNAGSGLNILNKVSCATWYSCTAVGYDVPPNTDTFLTLVEHWDGLTWQIQPTNSPGVLTNVSCPTPRACVAVGSSGSVPLAEYWDGSTWQVLPVQVPAGATSSYFEGVSCATSVTCVAVGAYFTSTDTYFALAERWNGYAWQMEPSSNPQGATASQLNAVSCATPNGCTAVGFSEGVGLAESWNGSIWQIEATASGEGPFQDVSCPLVSACTAVGDTFAERWNGAAWQLETVPLPTASTALVAVSCPTTWACTAAGTSFLSSSEEFSTVAEFWNGSTWQVQTTQNAAGSSFFSGVSCVRSGECTAVGFSGTTYVTLAERRGR